MLGLAPDAASAKAGQGLATPRPWSGLGRNERAVWGLCAGSGSKPYQAQVDLTEPAFKCSCPSRKFPCKHALGLLLLWASTDEVAAAEPPEWVTDWLASREARAERAQVRSDQPEREPDPAAQARRVAKREARVAAGIDELRRWLADLVRRGLGEAQREPYGFWDLAAARLVDAQAPGLAGRVRRLAGARAAGDRWAERLLEDASLLHLVLEAYERLEALPAPLQAEVRQLIGWTVPSEEVLKGERVRDTWAVLGQVVLEEDRLRVQRTWLRGEASGRAALLLSFTAQGQALDVSLLPGTRIDASLSFFPGSAPIRALVAERHGEPRPLERLGVHATCESVLAARAAALAQNPWLDRLPVAIRDAVPARVGDGWLLLDATGAGLPIDADPERAWKLAACSGGRPIDVFAELDRDSLTPVSLAAEGRFVQL